ncbi:hypothetical protein FA15DRAFT_507785 [Coprinopsis marcescibilis]|uniref:F-box domain-containing protein n=1 Tax=Coprinopsis marcescibilis TaxID=230819 RepID=A0A5C3L834_COPMA|nr:hypothetical protein FA15DRAFT_507785 [Coprinopsis marcescibilis]
MACLPPELVQLTIGHLKGDKPALRNASLVCSEFRHPCQKLLFSELDIAVRLSASRVATAPGPRLLALFKESHHLTFYVRKITIDFDSFCPKTCASSDPKLPLALNLIPYGGVREVRLNGVVWEVLQPATQNAIARHLRSPSLHSLSLNLHLHRPTDTVSLPSQNREVSLAVPYHKSERLDSMPIRLKSLRVSIQYPKQLQITSQFLLDKVNNIDLKGLQQFYACTGLDSSAPDVVPIYESTWRLVGGCAGSLEVLGYTPCKLGE